MGNADDEFAEILSFEQTAEGLRRGFVATNQMGASLHEVRMELAGLLGLATVFVVLGLRKWRRLAPPR